MDAEGKQAKNCRGEFPTPELLPISKTHQSKAKLSAIRMAR